MESRENDIPPNAAATATEWAFTDADPPKPPPSDDEESSSEEEDLTGSRFFGLSRFEDLCVNKSPQSQGRPKRQRIASCLLGTTEERKARSPLSSTRFVDIPRLSVLSTDTLPTPTLSRPCAEKDVRKPKPPSLCGDKQRQWQSRESEIDEVRPATTTPSPLWTPLKRHDAALSGVREPTGSRSARHPVTVSHGSPPLSPLMPTTADRNYPIPELSNNPLLDSSGSCRWTPPMGGQKRRSPRREEATPGDSSDADSSAPRPIPLNEWKKCISEMLTFGISSPGKSGKENVVKCNKDAKALLLRNFLVLQTLLETTHQGVKLIVEEEEARNKHDSCPAATQREKKERKICEICFIAPVEFRFEPCGHQMCEACVSKLSDQVCPWDRQVFSMVSRIETED